MRKIYLTESQVNNLITEGKIANYLSMVLGTYGNNKSGIEKLQSAVRRLILAGFTVASIIAAISNMTDINDNTKQDMIEKVEELAKDDMFNQKVQEVTNYINYALNNKGYKLEDLKFDPADFVKYAETYNFSLPLMLAQAHLESCFGMTPRAQKTNSMFSVGLYDSGKNICTFSNQSESIGNYIRTMQKYYLNNKTIDDLLSPNGFVNDQGKRYASDSNYESKIKNVMARIEKMCPSITK